MRYAYRGKVPKNLQWFDETLQQLDEKRFRIYLRCSRQQFNIILGLIEDHPAFNGVNSEKQFSVAFQLAIVLYRLGCNGRGATIATIAALFGVSDGGTIDKITRRVFDSVLSLQQKFLYWPSTEERQKIVSETSNELLRWIC